MVNEHEVSEHEVDEHGAPAEEHRRSPAASGEDVGQRLVREVMSSAVVTVPPTASVQEALRTLEAHHLHSAPVLAADGRLVGVISEADLRRAIRLPVLEAIDPAGCLHHQVPNRVPDAAGDRPDDVDLLDEFGNSGI